MSKKMNSLNGLKGLLIWSVVLFHTYRGENIVSSFFEKYGGVIGNNCFFAISGFLTCYSFFQHKKICMGFAKWFFQKLVRIYPLYAFFNLIQVLWVVLHGGKNSIVLSDLFLVFTMQTGGALTDSYPYDYPGWFVCTLFVCFTLFFFVNHISHKYQITTNYLFILLVFVGMVLRLKNIDFPFLYIHDGEAFVPFFLGCLISSNYEFLKKQRYGMYIVAGVSLVLCTLFAIGDISIIFSFVFIPAMILFCIENKYVNIVMNSLFFIYLSKISVFVYLTHALDVFTRFIQNSYFVYVLMLLMCCTVFYLIDTFIRKKIRCSASVIHE